MRRRRRAPGAGVVSALASLAVLAQGVVGQTLALSAEAGVSSRFFPGTPGFDGQASSTVSPSITFAPEVVVEADNGRWWAVAEGFARLDAHDGNRSHMDVRELGAGYLGDSFTAFVGFGQVFWGVTEVRHLVDIVNQIDAVEDLDGEDKLGQPMISLSLERQWATVDLFYLPYFRERTFPGPDARLRGPIPVADDPSYPSGRGPWEPSFAARAFRTAGALDFGVSGFWGTSREPTFALEGEAGEPLLRPQYDRIDQVGVDVQWTGERTLLKLEAVSRGGHGNRFYAATGGVERTTYQAFGGGADLGLLGEVMFDSRDASAPPTLFDHDVFLGGRLALNDVAGSTLLAGPLIDLETGETLVLIEGARRLGNTWRFSVDARLFANTEPGSLVHGLRSDDYVAVTMTRYF